jgi:hypothetical protein
MRNVIFYRTPDMKADELEAAAHAGFHCIHSRMQIQAGDLVVGRYSVLPYYKEIAKDVGLVSAQLINSVRQHHYIADMRNWVEELGDLTPKTWYRTEDVPPGEPGPFFLKGETNSRKEAWKTHAFAKDRAAVDEVFWRLSVDGFLSHTGQDIYVRKYVPLVTYAHGINGLPITKEFRFFVCRKQVLSGAYYWSEWADTCLDQDPTWQEPDVNEVPLSFLDEVIGRVGDRTEFYAIDAGQDINGRWWVVELNDGQMSGLSGNKPEVLYQRLFEVLNA